MIERLSAHSSTRFCDKIFNKTSKLFIITETKLSYLCQYVSSPLSLSQTWVKSSEPEHMHTSTLRSKLVHLFFTNDFNCLQLLICSCSLRCFMCVNSCNDELFRFIGWFVVCRCGFGLSHIVSWVAAIGFLLITLLLYFIKFWVSSFEKLLSEGVVYGWKLLWKQKFGRALDVVTVWNLQRHHLRLPWQQLLKVQRLACLLVSVRAEGRTQNAVYWCKWVLVSVFLLSVGSGYSGSWFLWF